MRYMRLACTRESSKLPAAAQLPYRAFKHTVLLSCMYTVSLAPEHFCSVTGSVSGHTRFVASAQGDELAMLTKQLLHAVHEEGGMLLGLGLGAVEQQSSLEVRWGWGWGRGWGSRVGPHIQCMPLFALTRCRANVGSISLFPTAVNACSVLHLHQTFTCALAAHFEFALHLQVPNGEGSSLASPGPFSAPPFTQALLASPVLATSEDQNRQGEAAVPSLQGAGCSPEAEAAETEAVMEEGELCEVQEFR